MQWKSVELFCAVVAERSFSRGAAQLGLSQSAASQAISLLETELGVHLINRGQRPLDVTPAGQIYYEGCRQLLADYRAIEDRVRGVHTRVIGTVRVAAIYSVGLLQMERFVRRFEEEFPDAVLRLEYQHPDRVYEQLKLDQVDVGLLSYPRTGTELVSIPWQEQPMVLVVAPGHPLGKKLVRGRLAPQALAGVTFLGFTRELPIRRAIDRWLRQEGVQVRVQHEFDNIETIKKAVECGSGVAILPEATVGQEVLAGTLVALPLGGAVLTRPLGIVHKKHRHLSPAVRQFVERLAAEVGVVAANSAEVLASPGASNGVPSIAARRGEAELGGARLAATPSDPIHSGVTDPGVIRPGELFEEGAAAQSNAVRRELLRAPSNAAVGQGLPATGAAPQNSPAQVKQSRGQARAGKLAAVSGTSHTASPPPLKAKRAGVAEASPGRARRAPRRKPT